MTYQLPDNTPLRMVAIHKVSLKKYEKIVTFYQWRTLYKKNTYFYYAYQL